ncbi:MAG: hypothetical protein NW215_01635 [Hyphomicrobiales bacterium]|nr:hypothetical protein [Hyphomicrobiales bacterium]
MKKLIAALGLIASAGALSVSGAQDASAQGYHSRNESRYEYNYYRPRPPRPSDGCLGVIRATGVGNVIAGIARINATRAWNREVRSTYGPGFSWAAAKNQQVECERVKLTVRCTARARPCRR